MSVAQQPTANDLFKQRSARNIWGGVLAAVAVHALLFALAPTMTITRLGAAAEEVAVITPLDDVPPPPAPEDIVQPGPPVVGDVDPDITIPPNTDLYDTREPLPGPPVLDSTERDEIDAFMPRDVNPVLKNGRQVQRLLEQTYPPLLRDAGVGGTVVVWFFIDENGRVEKTQLNKSSGYDALDQAAMKVADVMEFSAALNRDKKVPVWVAIPIVFSSN